MKSNAVLYFAELASAVVCLSAQLTSQGIIKCAGQVDERKFNNANVSNISG